MGAIQGSVLRAPYSTGPVWTGFFERPLWLLSDPCRAELDYRRINLIETSGKNDIVRYRLHTAIEIDDKVQQFRVCFAGATQ